MIDLTRSKFNTMYVPTLRGSREWDCDLEDFNKKTPSSSTYIIQLVENISTLSLPWSDNGSGNTWGKRNAIFYE